MKKSAARICFAFIVFLLLCFCLPSAAEADDFGSEIRWRHRISGTSEEENVPEEGSSPAPVFEDVRIEINGLSDPVSCSANGVNVDTILTVTATDPEGRSYDLVFGQDYTLSCSEDLFGEPIVTVSGTGDYEGETDCPYSVSHQKVTETFEIPANCTESGSIETAEYCEICGEVFSSEIQEIPCVQHTPGVPVRRDIIEATYESDGSYRAVVSCKNCGEILSERECVLASARNETPVIAMFGDSFTKGVGGTRTNLPLELGNHLGVVCDNCGVGGIGWLKTSSAQNYLTAYDVLKQTDLSAYNTFILCFGINDSKLGDEVLGTWDSTDEETVVGMMRKALDYLVSEKPDSRIIILAPFIRYDSERTLMRATFKAVAEDYGFPYIDQDDCPFNTETMYELSAAGNGGHPSNKGYIAIGKWLARKVRSILCLPADISQAKVTLKTQTFTDSPRYPSQTVTLKVDGRTKTLKKGRDYTVVYENNINAGTAKATLTGKGAYTGTISSTFRIRKVTISSVELKYARMPYTGSARTQTGSTVVKAKVNGSIRTLTNGTDYKITYKNNINAGTATLTVTGKGNYTGTIRKTFRITPVTLRSATLEKSFFYYNGSPRTQTGTTVVKAKVGNRTVTLKRNRDYTITYKNNVNVGTAKMIISGRGNYIGTIVKTFKIIKRK